MKTVAFCWEQVIGTFADSRTHGRDRKSVELGKAIAAHVGYTDNFIDRLAALLAYTSDLKFNWKEGAPDSMRALEAFWQQYQNGVDVGKCFVYYSDNVDNVVLAGQDADYDVERVTDADLEKLEGAKVIVTPKGTLFKSVLKAPEIVGWEAAALKALAAWQPPEEWKLLSELTEEQRNDPAFLADGSKSG